MSIQDQYTDTIRQSQDTWTAMIQSLTDNATKAFRTTDNPFPAVDPNVVIDQVFDFWTKAFDVQRDAAKRLVGLTVAASEKVRSEAESFSPVGDDKTAGHAKPVKPDTASGPVKV